MANMTENMDSVFDNCSKEELEFDTLFDQEDSLIDTVAGVTESGDPVTGDEFAELHQTDDDATPKDIEDELGEGHNNDFGAKDPEGAEVEKPEDNSVKDEVDKDSEADKVIGEPEEEYQDAKDSTKDVDEDDIMDTINAVIGECEDNSVKDEVGKESEADKVIGEPEEEYQDMENSTKGVDEDDLTKTINAAIGESEEMDIDPDDILDDEEEIEETVSGADADVEAMVKDDEDVDPDDVLSDDEGSNMNLDYELSDEDIIDMAINGKTF